MLKHLLCVLALLISSFAHAAVDANKADQAALQAVRGIGPAVAARIVAERQKALFKDWNDLVDRVKGVGEGNAARFSRDGLTVNGTTFQGAPPPSPAKPAPRHPPLGRYGG